MTRQAKISSDERTRRMLVAIYRLRKGNMGKEARVAEDTIWEEIDREKLFDLSFEEFDDYRKKVLVEVTEWRRKNYS